MTNVHADRIRFDGKRASIAGLAASPRSPPLVGPEIALGARQASDEEILAVVRKITLCGTHAVRSCRIGHEAGSVVDERARARGVYGRRGIDCSIIAGLASGNANGRPW